MRTVKAQHTGVQSIKHIVKGRSRREEMVLSGLRFDHNSLSKTLFLLGEVQSQLFAHCNITELIDLLVNTGLFNTM